MFPGRGLEQEVVGRLGCSAVVGNRLGCTVDMGHCGGALESNGSHYDVQWIDLDCTGQGCPGGLGCSCSDYRQTYPCLIIISMLM